MGTVARRKMGPTKPHAGMFKPGKQDRRVGNGRPKGSPNRLPASLKEAIIGAYEFLGVDGTEKKKGQKGLMGYFIRIFAVDYVLATRLAERILPMQITGAGGGPVQVLSIPPEMLKHMSTPELEVLEGVLKKLGGVSEGGPIIEHDAGDAVAYAKAIGVTEH